MIRRRSSGTLLVTAALVVLPACRRDESAAPADAGTDASPAATTSAGANPASSPPDLAPAPEGPSDHSLPATEPRRSDVKRIEDDPRLSLHRDAVLSHFGEHVGLPLSLQVETLPGDRQALLIQDSSQPDKPLVLVVAADGTRAWTKEMPLAGVVPGVREMTVVRGPEASVGVAFCDAAGGLAALRAWTSEGGIFADYEVVEIPHCEAISALYWPGHGHVVVAAGEGEARASRIDERGMRAWGRSGLTLPWKPDPGAAVGILVDTEDTFVLVGAGTAEGPLSRREEAVFAMRYDERGKGLWPAPIAVGRPSGKTPKRPTARVVAPGKMEVEMTEGAARRRLELSSEGTVIVLPERR
ncbi:hypothetical protein [Polyangium fumosum]|uniref:Uncharacterized protein n=1 Tax=Polyangium fumosum TaxID=889272 RepID=A0A4U1IVU2_9BACT|nr:hypothetical protein [Polyangium fumosum]TKC98639.1 hypothetical protein E8A74_40420 [Polyangium fumosum]